MGLRHFHQGRLMEGMAFADNRNSEPKNPFFESQLTHVRILFPSLLTLGAWDVR